MDFDAFKKLPEGEALAAAGKIAGVDASVFDGIWRTESSRGRAMLSPAGARGHFGLMPDTQASLEKRFARKIDPDNFHDSLFASAELMRENLARFGSLPDALRAYNGGWKSEKWDNPETRAYVGKVLGTDSAPQNPEVIAAYAKGEKKVKRPLTANPLFADPRFVDQDKALNELADGIIKEAQQASDTSLLDSAQAAFMNQGLASIPLAAMVRPTFEPTPGFTMTPQKAAGLTEDEIAQLATARSEAEEDYELQRIMWARDDMAEVGRGGMLQAIGASLVAGLPESILLGRVMAVPRLVANSVRSAEQVKRANYVRSAVENIGGNVAATALEDALTHRVSAADYPIGAAMGLIGVAADIPATRRGVKASAMQAERELAERALVEAGERKAEYNRKAIEALGPDATQEQVVAEAIRLETADAQRLLASAAAPRIENPLMPDLGKLEADEAEALAAPQALQSAAPTAADVGLRFNSSINEPGQGKGLLNADTLVPPNAQTALATPATSAAKRNYLDVWQGWKDNGTVIRGADIERALENDDIAIVGTNNFRPEQVEAMRWLHKTFIGKGHKIAFGDYAVTGENPRVQGDALTLDSRYSVIRMRPDSSSWAQTLTHEIGHIVLHRALDSTDSRIAKPLAAFKELHKEWLQEYMGKVAGRDGLSPAEVAALGRGAVASPYTAKAFGVANEVQGFIPSLMDVMADVLQRFSSKVHKVNDVEYATKYIPNIDEFAAEQLVKFVEAALQKELKWKPAYIPEAFLDVFREVWRKMSKLFNLAKTNGLLAPDARAVDFFEGVRKVAKASASVADREAAGVSGYRDVGPRAPKALESAAPQQEPDISFLDSPIAQKYGLGLLPVATPQQRAEAKALIAVYERADQPTAPWNNIDKDRISIMQKSASLGSTGLHLLTSANPVARMFAYEMLESTTGAGGRHVTGALAKYLSERRIVGTLQPEYEGAYALWRQANGGSIVEDHWGGTVHERFNREVAREIERRNQPDYDAALANPFVAKAADALERSFERSRIEQVNAKVTGWGGLPNTSRGYMPHSMSPEKLRNATKAQREALHSALVDQFVSIEGWDISFSANLASKYMDRVHQRGTGGYETTANIHSVGAADMIEDALTAMGMSQDEVRAQMQRYMRGAAKHTKARIKLDLSREYTDAETGKTFTLLDLFDTDVVGLARKQARRVSGEVALAQRGIMGRPGLKLMKRAIGFGETGTTKASDVDLTAFDQVAAEFLGDPFGKQQSKFMERAMTTNSLVRLGGMGFTQMSELFNAMFTLGVRNTAAIIPQFARLRAEAAALARGEKVNSILTSIETSPFGGEIGTDAYKMAFPFDSPSQQYQVNGAESITAFDRLIRRGSQVQGMLSGWRAIHAAQQRGVAEQIVLKSLRYIRDGKNDAALADMGITKEVADAMRAEFANTVVWSPDGKVQEFDIGKMENTRAAEAYIQAVHRGTGQLIQQTFIGETGAWAHNDWLKLMTQFRTFSITSMEKQWTRNRANHGVQKALAMVIATIAAGAPIYIARAYASSIGRDDQEEYLERRLSWEAIARGSMNYSAMTGLAPDLVDAIASVTGHSTTGGRIGTGTEFFGGTVAPALGLADQAYKAIQNTKDGTDLSEAMRVLPMNGLPFVTQAINAMVN
jgi:hypothetical protein